MGERRTSPQTDHTISKQPRHHHSGQGPKGKKKKSSGSSQPDLLSKLIGNSPPVSVEDLVAGWTRKLWRVCDLADGGWTSFRSSASTPPTAIRAGVANWCDAGIRL